MARWISAIDRGIGAVTRALAWLVLPMSLLLFLQWPLRELVQMYSREANDIAQVLFAFFVSVAVTHATRSRVHLAADALAVGYRARTRERLARVASLFVLAPWSLFLLVTAWPSTLQSVLQLEGFPETYSAGYFLIRLALMLLAALVLLQAIVEVFRRDAKVPQ
jgi:TRAP-type mannitol/chloroaromatic compound transport system permease small subunit